MSRSCHTYILTCMSLFLFHLYRVTVLDKVTDFLLFLGKLLIVGLVGERNYLFPGASSPITRRILESEFQWAWLRGLAVRALDFVEVTFLPLTTNPVMGSILPFCLRSLCLLFLLWKSEGFWRHSAHPQLLLGSHPGKTDFFRVKFTNT